MFHQIEHCWYGVIKTIGESVSFVFHVFHHNNKKLDMTVFHQIEKSLEMTVFHQIKKSLEMTVFHQI